jgi:hypothetical protein
MTDARPLWIVMADMLCEEGWSGAALLAELRARFPHAKRDDVYRAIATAWTYQQAGWLLDHLELEGLRAK